MTSGSPKGVPSAAALKAADLAKTAGDALATARNTLRQGTLTAARLELIREATRLRTQCRDLETKLRLHAAPNAELPK